MATWQWVNMHHKFRQPDIRGMDIVTAGNTRWSEDTSDCYGNLGSEEQGHLAMDEQAP